MPGRSIKRRYEQFLRAAHNGDGVTVARLIRRYPDLRNYEGHCCGLVWILHTRAPGLLERAFRAGLSPDAGTGRPFQTFLQKAACEGNLEQIRLAIRYGADPEKRNDHGEVALGYACSWGQLEAARLLVEAGADVNAVEEDPITGYRNTPLDCTHQYVEITEYLRSHGAKHLEELEPESRAAQPTTVSGEGNDCAS